VYLVKVPVCSIKFLRKMNELNHVLLHPVTDEEEVL